MYVLAGYAQRRAESAGERVLILDVDVASRNAVATILGEAGYLADTCSTSEAALDVLAQGHHGVLVTQHSHNLSDGWALARKVQEHHTDVSVILIAGDKALGGAVAALQAGVFDFMTKSFDRSTLPEQLIDAMRRNTDSERGAVSHVASIAPGSVRDPLQDVLVGDSTLLEQARVELRGALSDSVPVLISGETGTEKLAVARFLHEASDRRQIAFVVVDTAQTEAASALARSSEPPAGTLFFPEVSTLDSVWHMELVKRLSELTGSAEETWPRLIAGLNQPPAPSWEGSVTRRLFNSVGARYVQLPPLRERGRDVVILAEHFAEQVRLAHGDASLRITGTALEALSRYAWPGNLDELRFAIQHAASLCTDSTIRVADLPPGIGLSLTGSTDESGTRLEVQSLEDMELAYILRVLDAVGGNKASAARLLGVDRTTLYRKLQRQEQSAVEADSAVTRRARK